MPLSPALYELLIKLERQVLERADWGVFLTQLGASNAARGLALLPEPPTSWHVVPHAKRPWQLPSREAARRQLGWATVTRVLLCVGQIVPGKPMDWVLRAMQGAPELWHLVILGDGDALGLQTLARDLGLAPPTILATDDPRPYFAAADAFTSASAMEAFPMAHIEALQSGLAVACTAVGGVPELVGDAACLLPDEPTTYAEGLRRFLADDCLRQRYATAALRQAEGW